MGHLSLNDLSRVTASALALTYVPYFEGFGIPLVEAMKTGTPILAANATSLPEVALESAIYCDPFDVNSISNGMKLIFKDKDLRSRLAKSGLERSNYFNWHTCCN